MPSGAEDTAWYGDLHLEPMTKSVFEAEAANSSTGMAGAAGVWSGLPVTVIYVHMMKMMVVHLWRISPDSNMAMDTIRQGICWIWRKMEEDATYSDAAIHNNMVIVFSRCPHLCCIQDGNSYLTTLQQILGSLEEQTLEETNCSASATRVDMTQQ